MKQNESFYNFECTETRIVTTLEISWAISWVPDKEHTFITPDIFSKICSHFVTAAEISVPTCNA